ncbi:uncharacterized [Tachysurus ichikawai]
MRPILYVRPLAWVFITSKSRTKPDSWADHADKNVLTASQGFTAQALQLFQLLLLSRPYSYSVPQYRSQK